MPPTLDGVFLFLDKYFAATARAAIPWAQRTELILDFGKLKFRFFGLPSTTNRYVGIWYNKGGKEPQYADILWVANQNNPIKNASSGFLKIDNTEGNLKIFPNDQGNPIAITSVGSGVGSGTGNRTYFVNEDVSNPKLRIEFLGGLQDDDNSFLSCPYSTCGVEELPACRGNHLGFMYKHGFMSGDGMKFKENDDIILRDCKLKCLNNCSCVAMLSPMKKMKTVVRFGAEGHSL
ncbi:hypothetical protein EZV62_004008 [Acer yangbiense]|uniref:Apple domain-containing protein n=1 Tax=Acer yangbiense TaxID=1000413 RepID=A0A5C7IIJ7_9ROSI|nr:hypothetical protein EZV62_004008 [Acer yangbiense]